MKALNRIKARTLLTEDEGFSEFPYLDTKGILTIAHGRNLEAKGLSKFEVSKLFGRDFNGDPIAELKKRGISKNDARLLLENDIEDAFRDLKAIFGEQTEGFSMNRTAALVNMLFNLGRTRFLTFKKMIFAILIGDWEMASYEALNSKWARQDVGKARSERIAKMLKEG